ncbi:MAG: ABC transporter permease [Rhodobacter sp.]|uniref:ABC transporter permease n=1 Tax=Pararhodobacter sp. TaxID=2127056 RepID=UPI001D9A3DA3|nr:ABC transporter permease [Pararhodobacter sp.]MCB1346266.1 ABC transporter permease [Paracoccaceae bacterium]MCC0072769.1 ABC transporter permease [Rhodobacter sp.]HPD92091.1 ABC transporter permease [Pararhodobacter sp.]
MTDTTVPKIEAVSPLREAWQQFLRNKPAVAGLVLLIAIVLFVLYGRYLVDADPYRIVWAPLSAPGANEAVPLGTDFLGRDMLILLLKGGAPTMAVGLSAALLTVIIGISVGALAGYFGGWIDDLLMRFTEFFQVLPALLFAMVLVTLFSPSLVTISFAIGIVSWPATARLTRAEFLRIRELEYVTAARSIGAGNQRIIWKVILPNALPPLIVSAALTVGVAILFEAGLSFLGLGDPNTISWGLMIGQNRAFLLEAWWPVAIPGIAIFLTVFAVSLVGDGLNDAFNPKLRSR